MKIKLFVAVLFMAVIGLSACGGGDDKSSACDITSFKVNGEEWYSGSTSITHQFPKGTPETSLTPTIKYSDKASINPASDVAQNFFTTTGVDYTVTAEDGTKKIYNVKATVALQ